MSTSSSEILGHLIYSRRLLLHKPFYHPPAATSPASNDHRYMAKPYTGSNNNIDVNVVMVLSVLLCALLCSLGLNSIIKCALRFSRFGNRIGNNVSIRLTNTGIKKKVLKMFPVVNYGDEPKLHGMDAVCVICLSEFAPGERVRLLPTCNHGFHVQCIDRWLKSHSSCPTCRHCLIDTCHKIVGCSTTVPPSPSPPQETILRIVPLEPEGMMRSYQT